MSNPILTEDSLRQVWGKISEKFSRTNHEHAYTESVSLVGSTLIIEYGDGSTENILLPIGGDSNLDNELISQLFDTTVTYGDSLEWDGNATGKEVTGNNGIYVKVSDLTPSTTDLANGVFVWYEGAESETNATANYTLFQNQVILILGFDVVIALEDCTVLSNSYTKGIYFVNDTTNGKRVKSLRIAGYNGFPTETKTLKPLVTEGELEAKGYLTSIPSEYVTEQELNAKGYLTEHQSLDGYAKITDIPTVPTKVSEFTNDSGYLTSVPTEYVTETELNNKGYLTQHQDLSSYAKKTEVPTKTSQLTNDSGFLTEHQSLSAYSTTAQNDAKYQPKGNYLTSIPTEYVTESELTSKGYLTEVPSEYITESELTAKKYLTSVPSEYVTETELSAKGYLTSIPSEYVTDNELTAKGYQTVTSADSKYQPKGNYLTSIPSEYVTRDELDDIGGASSWNDLTDKPFGEIENILVEQHIESEFDPDSDNCPHAATQHGDYSSIFEVGKQYFVEINRQEYLVEYRYDDLDESYGFGSPYRDFLDALPTGEGLPYPFFIANYGSYLSILTTEDVSGNFKIYTKDGIKYLDSKYLPEHLQFGEEYDVLFEQQFEAVHDGGSVSYVDFEYALNLEEGKTYIVEYDGNKYKAEITYDEQEEAYLFGYSYNDLYDCISSGITPPQPFAIAPYYDFSGFSVIALEDGTHTLKIMYPTIKTIDTKYLPEYLQPCDGVTKTTILEELSIRCSGDCDLSDDITLIEGHTYIVTWDGTEYECIAWCNEGGATIVGNGDIWGGNGGNGEPFSINSEGGSTTYLNVDESGTYTIKIEEVQSTQYINPKYLPEYLQFGETGGDTLTWDGNTDGLECVEDVFYKVSNTVLTKNDFANGGAVSVYIEGATETSTFTQAQVQEYDGAILVVGEDGETPMFYIITEDGTTLDAISGTSQNKGIYLMCQAPSIMYMSSITINGYTGFPMVKPIDSKYLPEHLQFSYSETVLLDNQSLEINDGAGMLSGIQLKNGATYKVVFNGANYTCMAYEFEEGALSMGNFSMISPTFNDTGEPFYITVFIEDGEGYVYAVGNPNPMVMSIIEVNSNPLKTQYLPRHLQFGGADYSKVETLIDNQTITYSEPDNTYLIETVTFTIEENATYKIVVDGVEYEMVGKSMPTASYIGNSMLVGLSDTGEPLIFATIDYTAIGYGIMGILVFADGRTNDTTISLYKYGVKPIDTKYLPEHLQFGESPTGGVTYTLSKSGSNITLTGSDGSTQTVQDSDTNTTYSQGNETTLGLTKLYTSTGSNTDGAMTQAATTSYVDESVEMVYMSMPAGKPYTWDFSDMTGVINMDGMLVKVISPVAYGLALSGTVMTITPISGETGMTQLVPLDPNPYLTVLVSPDLGEECMMMSVNSAYAAMLGIPFSGTLIAVSEGFPTMYKSITVSAGADDNYFVYVNHGESSDILTWDGDTTGKAEFDGTYKVSDMTFTAADCANGGTIIAVTEDGTESTITFTSENMMAEGDAVVITSGDVAIISIGSEIAAQLGLEVGTYFSHETTSTGTTYVKSLTINGYTFSKQELKLDPKYLSILNEVEGDVTSLGNTLTWDGNTDGKHCVDASNDGTIVFVNVSDATFTEEDLIGGITCLTVNTDGTTKTITWTYDEILNNSVIQDDGFINLALSICVVPTDNYSITGSTFAKSGIYLVKTTTQYISSLTLNSGEFKVAGTAYEINSEYLPEHLQFGEVNGDSNTLDLLTATNPYGYVVDGDIQVPLYYLKDISSLEDLYGISGELSWVYNNETFNKQGTVTAENTQKGNDTGDGTLSYVSLIDSECGLMFINAPTDIPAGDAFSLDLKTGWYFMDYMPYLLKSIGVVNNIITNRLTAPKPIFTGGFKYFSNEYLDFMEKVGGASDTLTWDGDTTGKYTVTLSSGAILCKVSDVVITKNDVANGTTLGVSTGETTSINGTTAQSLFLDDGFGNHEVAFMIPTDNYVLDTDLIVAEKGVYFVKTTDLYTTSFTINGYTGFVTEKGYKIKDEYLPDNLGGGATSLTDLGVTATATELNYMSGVTSNIQTQLNAKVPTSRTINGKALSNNITLSASDVGLGNVNNTSDANKPVSTAQQTAINTALASAKTYADTAANNVKNDLLNGAGAAYDTLKELGELIDDNKDAIDALETVATGKADKDHTHSYLPLAGGTLDKTAAITWSTSSSKTPYIGYCTQSGDATFMVGSLTGTTYPTGLAIGGSSGNLLWKGNRVIDAGNISSYANNYTHPSYTAKSNGLYKVTVDSSGHVSGTTAVSQSDITALGIAPSQHISNKNSGAYYFPLATMVADNSSNYGNITITGRIGGWEQGNSANFEIMMLNRSSARDGNTITSTVSASGQVDQAFTKCDIVVYRQDDTSAKVYLKTNSYWLYDFDWSVYQHSMVYDGSKSADTPAGTLIWSLSTAPKTILNTDGSLKASRFIGRADSAINDVSGNAFQRVYNSMIPYGTSIGSNTDLNTVDCIKVGSYYCSSDAATKTLTNCPVQNAFMMQVYSPLKTTIDDETTNTYVYRVRKLMTYNGLEYIQQVYSGATAGTFMYGTWKKILQDGDITVSSLGAATSGHNHYGNSIAPQNIELNMAGNLGGFGGFIDFHYHNSSGQPTDNAGNVVSSATDYTSRIIEKKPAVLEINNVLVDGNNRTIECNALILKSTNSSKRFKVTIDDNGAFSATAI